MAAFGTKKPGGDLAVQLTFPGEFSRAYKQMKLGERYAPSGLPPAAPQEYVGNDFYAMEHQRRRDEAHAMVRAAVYATKEAKRRAFSSHCGYYGLPEPVLTQRVRGSNFGVGVGGGMGYPSPFMGEMSAGLEGGVIGSREGRAYVKDVLAKRKAQLDAIDASQLEGPTIQAQVQERAPNDFSELSKIELLTYMDQLEAQIEGKRLEFTADTFRKFLALLVRFAVVADRAEMEEVLARVLSLSSSVDDVANPQDDGNSLAAGVEDAVVKFAEVLDNLLDGVEKYLRGMFAGIDLQPRERATLSKSLLKDAQIARRGKAVIDAWRRYGRIPGHPAQFRPHGGDDDMPGDDDEGGDEGDIESVLGTASSRSTMAHDRRIDAARARDVMQRMVLPMAGVSRGTGARGAAAGMFSRQPISAELSGGPRGALSRDVLRIPDVRDRFGAQGQAGEARQQRRYADEEEGPGYQDEQDYEGDVAEAVAAADAEGLGGEDDEEVVRQAMALLGRYEDEFPEGTYARLREEAAAPGEGVEATLQAARAGVERGMRPAAALAQANVGMKTQDVREARSKLERAMAAREQQAESAGEEGYWSNWSARGYELPSVAADVERNAQDEESLDAWLATFSGKSAVPKLQRYINSFKAAADQGPTRSQDPYYLRNTLRGIIRKNVLS